MTTRTKQRTEDEAVRLGRLITECDRGNIPLALAIEVTVKEVVQRARIDLLLELSDECVAAGCRNAAKWLIEKAVTEFASRRGALVEGVELCELFRRKAGEA